MANYYCPARAAAPNKVLNRSFLGAFGLVLSCIGTDCQSIHPLGQLMPNYYCPYRVAVSNNVLNRSFLVTFGLSLLCIESDYRSIHPLG